ncbi:hypothetical protein [Gaoshiqia sp. Z1-71]|uniref:hypothetical protein n=1 Tax=Gaoshiqia hydrogeniformans TaxID=3290090 RepID=UPI003BF8E132
MNTNRLRKYLLVIPAMLLSGYFPLLAQSHRGELYQHLVFEGSSITYQDRKIQLGPNAFFIDGQLSDEEAAGYPFVFNSVNEAAKQLTHGTEESPMVLYMAPWVYWIDDPDDPEVRLPRAGEGTPFGLEIDCEWLKFHGLSDDPGHVILACNRGQTMGAKGNFTMFNIKSDGLCAENITFGNYCNIDLEYPLKPKLGREKRGPAIVQAQLIFSNGDKVFARNTHFISRLNLGPFWGSKRSLFDRCHFESTDDALNGSAVYLDCTFDFYGSKPFWGTSGTGAVFLNCNIESFVRGEQYFTKSNGQVVVIDTRFHSNTATAVGWRENPPGETRNYQFQNQLNDEPLQIGMQKLQTTVDLTTKSLLNAYRIELNDQLVYNTWNLLRGNDDWDPMGIKEKIQKAEKEHGKDYSNLPVQLLISSTRDTLETGRESLVLSARALRFGNYEMKGEKIRWNISAEDETLARLNIKDNGDCEVIPVNEEDGVKEITVTACTDSGLEAASVLYISPSILEAPDFSAGPALICEKGQLRLDYQLDMRFEDQSLISWYRCRDAQGTHPVEIAVSRFNKPLKTYQLSAGDIGYYIMARVSLKHVRCHPGNTERTIYHKAITPEDVNQNPHVFIPDLEKMSTAYQPEVLPGFWTLDGYAPADTREWYWEADSTRDPWYYGPGVDGAAQDTGLVQATKGARLRYTPVGDQFGDMKISFTAVPAKTAGQGFSSARAQYMDVYIKFDTKTLTGYALRLIRTTKYSDAIDFLLMKYENGNAMPISDPVSASCYRPDCRITVEVNGNLLRVHSDNARDYYTVHNESEVKRVVDLEAEMEPNTFGGIGFQHTGTVSGGATLIKDLKIEWN